MEKQWKNLSSDEKQEAMFQKWLSPQGIKFSSREAERAYKASITRIKDAIQLKKTPDRMPMVPHVGFFPAFNAGITARDSMYDYNKLFNAWKKYVLEFKPDAHNGAFESGSGKLFEILDYKQYIWPGHGTAPNHSYQCLEKEYVKADEYDALIEDPSGYFIGTYLPRVFGALGPFTKLAPFTNIIELPFAGANILQFGLPEVQTALKTLMAGGTEALKWGGIIMAFDKQMAESGFPNFFGGAAKAPFDVLGDTLRGTRGIILDMYRQPDKLLKAIDVWTPLMIKTGVTGTQGSGNPVVFIPLHKGADGFMSDEQFKKFYWPSLRKLLIALINEGCVPFCYAEGGYNTRLEIIKDLPRGKTIWAFDQTDMVKAKEALGDICCIAGNMTTALLNYGSPQQVKDYTKQLIDTAGKGGGFIMTNGAVMMEAKPANVKTWIDFTKEYGVY